MKAMTGSKLPRKVGTMLLIQKLRKEKGYTQIQISNKISISDRAYRNIELGKSKPSYQVSINLQNLFNESIDKLLNTF